MGYRKNERSKRMIAHNGLPQVRVPFLLRAGPDMSGHWSFYIFLLTE